MYQFEGAESLRVDQGIPRPGHGGDPDAGLGGQCLLQHPKRLLRADHPAGRSRLGLVGAVQPAVAVAALDVAARRHRQVDPAETVVRARIEAGVPLQILFKR